MILLLFHSCTENFPSAEFDIEINVVLRMLTERAPYCSQISFMSIRNLDIHF